MIRDLNVERRHEPQALIASKDQECESHVVKNLLEYALLRWRLGMLEQVRVEVVVVGSRSLNGVCHLQLQGPIWYFELTRADKVLEQERHTYNLALY